MQDCRAVGIEGDAPDHEEQVLHVQLLLPAQHIVHECGNEVDQVPGAELPAAHGAVQHHQVKMEEEGKGDLYAKFEALKNKLSEEGLFEEERKKPIPKFPETIGIVTSPTGAAIRDMINVFTRRCPMVKVIIYPCLVQGENAAQSIVQGI